MEKRLAEQCAWWYQQNWRTPTRRGTGGASARVQGGCGFGGFKSGCQPAAATLAAVGPLDRLAMARPAGGARRAGPLSCYAAQRPKASSPPARAAGWLAAVGLRGALGSLAGRAHGVERAAVLEPEEK